MTTTSSSVNSGIRQGDGTFTLLFNIALEEALKKVKESTIGINIGKIFKILAFADYVAILTERKIDLERLTKIVIQETKKFGLSIPK